MVLYGLLVPLFILLIGAGLDLGWYYLNVSRLQNAADAAVVAGAHALVDDINAKNSAAKISVTYNYDGTITDKYSADYLSNADTSVGDKAAANYALKNLSADNAAWTKAQDVKAYTLSDDWSREEASEVTLMPFLYESGENIYYVVHLTEKVEHLFLPGFFDAMDAPVVAVAMLTKTTGTVAAKKVNIVFDANGGTFDDRTDETSREFKAAESMEDNETSEPLYSGKDAPTYSGGKKEFQYYWSPNPDASPEDTSDLFEDGTQLTKNEVAALFGDKDTVTLYAVWVKAKPKNNRTLWEQMHYLIAKNVYNYYWYSSMRKYNAEPYNNSFINPKLTYYNPYGFKQPSYYTEQIDLTDTENSGRSISGSAHYYIDFFRTGDGRLKFSSNEEKNHYGNPYRVHSLFNVNTLFKVRKGCLDDPLYCRIESEPYKREDTPVRQIVLNINVDNTADQYRPLFFYYDEPETESGGAGAAAAQPVILNLNADFKGVLFMPDVPVVINGNGHKFEGFIVAKEFRYLNRRSGTRVKYSSDGKTVTNASDNLIRVNPSTGDVYSVLADGDDALAIFTNNEDRDKFNLNSASQFRTFKAETGVKYNYVFYDNTLTMDPSPFYLNTGDLVQLYKLVNGKQVRVTKWEDVKLYDAPLTDSTRKEIPKDLPYNDQNKGIVLLDSDGNPAPVYDEAGNPIYFSKDYVNLTGVYTVFTLDRVADGTRNPKEFLLPKNIIDPTTYEEKILTNTDDWK